MLGTRKQYDQKVSELVNQYAGKLIKVIRSEEPDVYALGTVEFAPVYDPLLRKGTITLECTDGDSYFYHVKESEVVISGSGTVTLQNDYACGSGSDYHRGDRIFLENRRRYL